MVTLKLYPTKDQKVTLFINREGLQPFKIEAVVHLITAEGKIELFLLQEEEGTDELIKEGISVNMEFFEKANYYKSQLFIEDFFLSWGPEGDKQVPHLVLSPPCNIEKVERRKFFRLPIDLTFRFIPVSFPEGFEKNILQRKQVVAGWHSQLNHQAYSAHAHSVDFSGGGLMMISEFAVSEGDEIFLAIDVPGLSLEVAARVVRSYSFESGDKKVQQVGVQFVGLDENEQDKIISFIFREQRRQRQRRRAKQ